MENYVHRTEGLGARVLITRIWYYIVILGQTRKIILEQEKAS